MRVVAFGGGHGLSASLRALRTLRDQGAPLDITAVVTVADDGGSSGRLRAERGVLPPGDLRQALVALSGASPIAAQLFQYRFDGQDPLAGHAVGNLVLTGLLELLKDPVEALEHAARLLDARGRVLPMASVPLRIEADVRGPDGRVTVADGQHAVAVSRGEVLEVRLDPPDPPVPEDVISAVNDADWLVLGPGSWYTSVIPHLLVPQLARAISASRSNRLVMLNLAAEKETAGLSLADHLRALSDYMSELCVDVVLADTTAVGDPEPVRRAAQTLGARLVLAPVAVADGSPRHDPAALAAALQPILGPRVGRHDAR